MHKVKSQEIAASMNVVDTEQKACTTKREFLKSNQMNDANLLEEGEQERAKTQGC